MTRFEFWLTLTMAAVTFPIRYLPLAAASRFPIPEPLLRALEYVPVAVLTAICAPTVLLNNDQLDLGWTNPYLAGSLLAIVLAWRFNNLLLTIVSGVAMFALWHGLF